jgi:hypothetical protein
LDRHDDHAALGFDEDVDEEQPTPRAQEESKTLPPAPELGPHERETLQRTEGSRDPRAGVGREAMHANQSVQVLERRASQLDRGHLLELVERHGLPGPRLLQTELRPLVCPRDPIEQLNDVAGVGVRLVDRAR